jgi:hypothetical protein
MRSDTAAAYLQFTKACGCVGVSVIVSEVIVVAVVWCANSAVRMRSDIAAAYLQFTKACGCVSVSVIVSEVIVVVVVWCANRSVRQSLRLVSGRSWQWLVVVGRSAASSQWVCGCVDVWMCGCVNVRCEWPVSVSMWVCVDVWMCGCADVCCEWPVGVWVWACGHVWVCGCVDVWRVCARENAWEKGRVSQVASGSADAWVRACGGGQVRWRIYWEGVSASALTVVARIPQACLARDSVACRG